MASGVVYNNLNKLLDDCIKYFDEQHNLVSFDSILQILRKIQENVLNIEPLAKDFIGWVVELKLSGPNI